MGSGYRGYAHTQGAIERFKSQELMNELRKSGVNYTEKEVVLVTKNYIDKLLWLEKGNEKSGLKYIMDEHKNNFKGINVPALIKILTKQKPISHYEKHNVKQLIDVYNYKKNGNTYLLVYDNNGYIDSIGPVGNMYQVKEIISYEFARNIVLQYKNHQQIKVFDDSALFGNNDFGFLKVGHSYSCKIGILGDMSKSGKSFSVDGHEKIGTKWFIKLSDKNQNVFYLKPDTNVSNESRKNVQIEIKRYDLLQVDNVVHGRYR
ncbi:hypothetical protein [Limosilactobacillus fastidiosus]|uniref:Uncharacterized protein n=1 Tax=Limosilactobacillus fastidiosus TaxID=2759855 RepID=A0A7W3TZT6_9LACO|nr:hypothetical protein [Limosilactobacillus fastidiosus]MBB1086030.1 hypothetical protein [Limosilactobacillus fastidiosus]MCD7085633.1 hypothetical protein [Limosilactobacillus fastidiosus]MCD7114159.1 hypothetical protein [Limosilactobacillus fastidiosus]MCD7116707.1 hypothetical protein [Limosilactobacillus fastidiosus]